MSPLRSHLSFEHPASSGLASRQDRWLSQSCCPCLLQTCTLTARPTHRVLWGECGGGGGVLASHLCFQVPVSTPPSFLGLTSLLSLVLPRPVLSVTQHRSSAQHLQAHLTHWSWASYSLPPFSTAAEVPRAPRGPTEGNTARFLFLCRLAEPHLSALGFLLLR